ncbi:hypothetical protein SKAU_G00209560 [Synaphobranchus kaupii]|uniref:SCAN box domain-containing protein n=1 Tax=Synaphobranchus kaupii TaxID=118154 RepID=A0A9Q1IUF3_SYNKA|nr:hypothetical protein SKAU_G00209560 [Synaphobranchus kaupii]
MGLRSQKVGMAELKEDEAWDTVEEKEFERLGARPRTSTPHQRREEGFLEELRGLRASILQAAQAAEGLQRPELTTTTMTAESPRMALSTPHRHTTGVSVTQPVNPSQQTATPPVHAEPSYMAPPAERVIRKEPKMPMLQQGEDIETYLLQFERIASTGVGLRESHESYHHLKGLYHRWIRLEQWSKEEIGELVILEQLLCILPYDTRTWVKEHEPDNGLTAAKLALQYINARRGGQQRSYSTPQGTRDPKDNRENGGNPVGAGNMKGDSERTATKGVVCFCSQAIRPLFVRCANLN